MIFSINGVIAHTGGNNSGFGSAILEQDNNRRDYAFILCSFSIIGGCFYRGSFPLSDHRLVCPLGSVGVLIALIFYGVDRASL